MFNNKCFCENCKKIKTIIVKKEIVKKEFNIGKIKYERLYGICNSCGSEMYSLELAKENKKKLAMLIKEIEEEMKMLKIIKGAETINFSNLSDEEIEGEIEKMITKYNKK